MRTQRSKRAENTEPDEDRVGIAALLVVHSQTLTLNLGILAHEMLAFDAIQRCRHKYR